MLAHKKNIMEKKKKKKKKPLYRSTKPTDHPPSFIR
jgi:hypothetical protein